MTHIISSNLESVKSIRLYNENFIIVHLHVVHQAPLMKYTPRYIYDIYYQDGMELDDSYESEDDVKFNLYPVASITEALDNIADELVDTDYEESKKDEDKTEEIAVICACNPDWNKQVTKYMNDQFSSLDSSLEAMNLYTYMKIGSMDRLVQSLKSSLNTEFVYPDEPISFAYALYQCVTRMF